MGTHEPSNCLPGAYACEHQIINPFVDYLNGEHGSHYAHLCCPDKIERNQPEPDTLYRDLHTGRLLAVEHKSLVWPPSFAERHRNDHLLMDKIFSLLDSEIASGKFVLELPYLLKASRAELEALASQIGAACKVHKEFLLAGGAISGDSLGRGWRLRKEDPLLSDYEEGIRFSWNLLDPKAYSSHHITVPQELQRLCEAAAKKFVRYSGAMRILLFELTGNIVSLLSRDLLAGCTIPSGIDEIWTAYFEYFDGGDEGWVYDLKWQIARPSCSGRAANTHLKRTADASA